MGMNNAGTGTALRREAVRLDGATRLVGVMGWPVAHSRSPQMHNAAFAALGLNYVYVPLAVPPEQVDAAVAGLVALGFAGCNVTVPHKQAVLRSLSSLTPAAAAVGAANTIVVGAGGTLLGDNTDGYGFLTDLAAHGVHPAAGVAGLPAPGSRPESSSPATVVSRALVIGAGGAARSVVYALAAAGVEVAVANRTLSKAEELCAAIARALPAAHLEAHPFPAALQRLASWDELVVNATSLGLHADDPVPWASDVPFRPGQVAYDLVYTEKTPFLALAAAGGARPIGGLGMLVHQGARSFELWTGHPAPVDVMAAAIRSNRE